MGIRYFDLRVCRTTDKNLHSKSLFTFTHGLLGHLVRESLEEIKEFLNKYTKEIILLDFNHFYDFNDQCGHDQLIHLIHEVFGKKLCTTVRTINECTLNYLWNHEQQVILLYEQNADQCTAYMDRIGHFFKVKKSFSEKVS
jgi:GGDEF domain-containing protein